MSDQSTIFALSSGAGVAGVAVIRLSGPKAVDALKALTNISAIKPRYATYSSLYHPESRQLLDKSLVLYFKGPFSFTGEDCVELQVHGGRAVIQAVFSALNILPYLRLAEPGEFTRRAFENGKMDLTEAEGLNDLIHAQTAMQRQLALKQMDGSLKKLYESWRFDLVRFLAHLEADIDFPDEDLPDGVAGAVKPKISLLRKAIESHLDDKNRGQALRDGFKIAILGAPNAGKSSLLNSIAKSDVAIVSDEAGTTRDAIELSLDLRGYPVIFIDTAGIRETTGTIEAEGIRRAKLKAEEADLRLVLIRSDEILDVPRETLSMIDEKTIILISQTDLKYHDDNFIKSQFLEYRHKSIFKISTKEEKTIAHLLEHIEDDVVRTLEHDETPILTRLRHRNALEDCCQHLIRFEENAGFDAVLSAEDVRMAARAIGSITGLVDVEELLDVIFSDFCIGK